MIGNLEITKQKNNREVQEFKYWIRESNLILSQHYDDLIAELEKRDRVRDMQELKIRNEIEALKRQRI